MAIDTKAWSEILPSGNKGAMGWDDKGVWTESINIDGKRKLLRLTPRPILPTATGIDQDDNLWLRVTWEDYHGRERTQWMQDTEARSPKALEALQGAPVDPTCSKGVARWMTHAPARVKTPARSLATRLGWIEGQYVWPGHLCDREWVGQKIDDSGDIEATTSAVRELTAAGEAGYLALVVLGLSAASPLVRWGCTRNPILGLAQSSSRGKSTAFGLALSLWGDPATWTLQGGSTVKGAQDLATMFPDTPILLEDLHKLHADRPEMVQDLLYYCGNGQRRITSSRTQVAKGGEKRWGTAFYGSEHEIMGGAMGGVVFRTWELSGDPMPDGKTARSIAVATQRGSGAAGPRLARHYSSYSPEHWRRVLGDDFRDSKGRLVDTSTLAQGDIAAVRCLAHGLMAVRQVLAVMELDPVAVCDWLTGQIGARRSKQADMVQVGWETLIQAVLGGMWGKQVTDNGDLRTLDENRLQINNEVIAWRLPGRDEESWEQLEVNTSATWAGRILSRHGGERMLLKAWAEREWIQRDGAHLKWLKRDHGRVAMRVSRAQLVHWTGPRPDDHGGQLLAQGGEEHAT